MLSTVFPVFCLGCNTFNEFLCDECAEAAKVAATRTREGFAFQVAFDYEGVVSVALSRLKQSNHYGYSEVLARHLAECIELDLDSEVITPPSTSQALRKRGFVPSYEIAKSAGMNVTKNLRLTRQTQDQQALDSVQRQQNLNHAFELLKPGRYLLFDDVVTTGATMREMIRATEDGGGEVVGVLALCSTEAKGAN
jgi:predicted amidophosphoribosyltransferase